MATSEGWERRTLGDLAVIFDGPHATPKKTEHGPWYLSISSLVGGRLKLDESAHLSLEDLPRWTKRVRPCPGDTLFSYETRLGDAAHWKSDIPAALGRRMGLLRPREGVDPRFLTYAYLGPEFQELIRERTIHGATVDRLPISEMAEWSILVPDYQEQRRISGVLGAIDDLIETNERLIVALRETQHAMYARAQKTATRTAHFGEMATLSKERATGPADMPYVGLEHFAEDGGGIVGVGRLGDTVSQQYSFERGDVLYGRLRPYFRKVDMLGFAGACTGEIWVLRSRGQLSQTFLHSVVASPAFTDHAMAGSGGTHMPRARWDHMASFIVAIPDAEKLREVDALALPMWEQAVALREEADQLRHTRDEVLPLLVSGKLHVRELEKSAA